METSSSKTLSINHFENSTFNRQLKVLHICQRDNPAEGGAVRVATEYVKRLPKFKINAHCLFLYGEPASFQKELGERAHYLNIDNSLQFWKFWRLLWFIWKFKPDIIHHHDGLLWSNILTFFHPRIIKVAHAHLCANNLSGKLRGLFAAWIQRQSADLLICITKDTQNSHIEIGGYRQEKTEVIYNGVDFSHFYPPTSQEQLKARVHFGIPPKVSVVGYVGRLDCTMKGADDFLKTFALLPSSFYALVAGSGCDRKYLDDLAKKLDITERVFFVGNLENPSIAYHAMDVFCLTSHWEHFGLVVAEAMACNVPVIALACTGGVSELLTNETGYFVQNRNLKAMAQAIIRVTTDVKTWEQRKKNARLKLEKNHNWQNNTLFLANLYRHMQLT